jgi:hypothetical protein
MEWTQPGRAIDTIQAATFLSPAQARPYPRIHLYTMFVSPRTAQLLRQKPVQDSIFQAATRRTLTKQTPPTFKTNAFSRSYFTARTAKSKPLRTWQTTYRDLLLRPFRNFRANSSKNGPRLDPTPHLGSPEPTGIKARLQKLSREYGWVALGVYLSLSVLDFPFCFLAVRLAGPERIGQIEHAILTRIKFVTAPLWEMIEPIIGNWRKGKEAVNEASEAVEKAEEHVEQRPAAASKYSSAADYWGALLTHYQRHLDRAGNCLRHPQDHPDFLESTSRRCFDAQGCESASWLGLQSGPTKEDYMIVIRLEKVGARRIETLLDVLFDEEDCKIHVSNCGPGGSVYQGKSVHILLHNKGHVT